MKGGEMGTTPHPYPQPQASFVIKLDGNTGNERSSLGISWMDLGLLGGRVGINNPRRQHMETSIMPHILRLCLL